MGKSVEDARDGGSSGCVEMGAFGKEAFILAGYFNIPKMLELALHDGVDPRTGRQIGPKTGNPPDSLHLSSSSTRSWRRCGTSSRSRCAGTA